MSVIHLLDKTARILLMKGDTIVKLNASESSGVPLGKLVLIKTKTRRTLSNIDSTDNYNTFNCVNNIILTARTLAMKSSSSSIKIVKNFSHIEKFYMCSFKKNSS